MNPSGIQIKNIRSAAQNGTSRICADVNGMPVWYESEDLELRAAPEVFASAFLIPAMVNGLPLCVEGAVSTVWNSNTQKLMGLFHEWWGYPVVDVLAGEAEPQKKGDGRTALFFTGGVDSFYSLLQGTLPIHDLIYVQGFDVSLEEKQRLADIRAHLGTVSEVAGKRLVVLRTNIREHPLIQQAGWGRVHGGVLASAAHSLLEVSTVIISSSYSRMAGLPWGSHWQSDPLWSSEWLKVVHFGDQVYRSEKLMKIADEMLVQQHLRVCWKNQNENLNCCECEKCVRTMLALNTCGKLDPCVVFPYRNRLPEMIRQVRYVMSGLIPVYESFFQQGLSLKVAWAVRGLLLRSRLRLARKTVLKKAFSVFDVNLKQDET